MDEQILWINHMGRQVAVTIRLERYQGGGLAVQLMDPTEEGMDYATVSINLGVPLQDDEFVFKTYSENEGLLEALVDARVVEMTGRFAEVGGFVGRQPICRLAER